MIFYGGLATLFLVLRVLIHFPLFGSLIVISGLILPFPKFLCDFISSGVRCGVSPAVTIQLEEELPCFGKGICLFYA